MFEIQLPLKEDAVEGLIRLFEEVAQLADSEEIQKPELHHSQLAQILANFVGVVELVEDKFAVINCQADIFRKLFERAAIDTS